MDLSFQNRYLLNGVEIRLRLIRSKDIFCLHGNAAGCKVSLKEVVLLVHKVEPNSSIQLAHTKALQLATAKYSLRRVEVKSFTVPMGNRSIAKKNLFLDQLPTQIVVGVVDNDAYNGAIKNRLSISNTTTSILLQFIVTVFKSLQHHCNLILQTIVSSTGAMV